MNLVIRIHSIAVVRQTHVDQWFPINLSKYTHDQNGYGQLSGNIVADYAKIGDASPLYLEFMQIYSVVLSINLFSLGYDGFMVCKLYRN